MRQVLSLALVSAVVIISIDLAFQGSVLRTVQPLILTPPDGALATAPVVVRWEGPQSLRLILKSTTTREDLGVRDNPCEIAAKHFPRPGQYSVELQSPIFGSLFGAERRFLLAIRQDDAERERTREAGPSNDRNKLRDQINRLQADYERSRSDNAALQAENESLLRQQTSLLDRLNEAREEREQSAVRTQSLEQQVSDLENERQQSVEELAALRTRIESLPPCLAWGYMSLPRPQTVPNPRRIVVASNGHGQIFRSVGQCEFVRRNDPTAASPCDCVASPW